MFSFSFAPEMIIHLCKHGLIFWRKEINKQIVNSLSEFSGDKFS